MGALVTFTACVNAAWTSSMEVGVRVEAENVLDGTIEHTNTAYLSTNRLRERQEMLAHEQPEPARAENPNPLRPRAE